MHTPRWLFPQVYGGGMCACVCAGLYVCVRVLSNETQLGSELKGTSSASLIYQQTQHTFACKHYTTHTHTHAPNPTAWWRLSNIQEKYPPLHYFLLTWNRTSTRITSSYAVLPRQCSHLYSKPSQFYTFLKRFSIRTHLPKKFQHRQTHI